MSTRYIEPARFSLVRGKAYLNLYQFGDRLVNHYFCRNCGIYVFHDATTRPGYFRVNLGCVEGVDPLSLEISLVDGKRF